MKTTTRSRTPQFRLRSTIVALPLMSSLTLLPFTAIAELPTGGRVTAGSATIGTPIAGSLVVNQTSQRAVVQWSDFTLGAGRSLTFGQPNQGASILNIATGKNASTLAGTLQANGAVFLVNPNGINIAPTGRINAQGGFVASTLGISEDDFMVGRLLFQGRGGAVVNQGDITVGSGGFAALLGSSVSNEGVIRAPLGKVALGAAGRATLDLSGDGFLQIMLPADMGGVDGHPLVNQSGRIEADGGIVLLKAAAVRQAMREAVNMPGEIRARSVSGQDGAIVLEGANGNVTVTGKLDVSADVAAGGTRGGRIDVSGDSVVLKGANIIATGPEQGGLVRLGGGFQGGRPQAPDSRDAAIYVDRFPAAPALPNAKTTSIDAASRIDVSSAHSTGGAAIVWSDGNTVMDGAIVARGAIAGGSVEISAKSKIQSVALERLDIGSGGTLLLDPKNIVIDGAASAVMPGSEGFSDNAGNTTQLNQAALVNLLGTGTAVNLMASNDITWTNGFAFVSQPAINQPAGDLSLTAGRTVRLSGSFSTGLGNWTLVANARASTGVVEADRDPGAASVDLRGARFVNSNGNFNLLLDDGAGRAADRRGVDSMQLGAFTGNSLTAEISPTAVSEFFSISGALPRMLLGYVDGGFPTIAGDVKVSGPIKLTAPKIQLANQTFNTLTYTSDNSTVTWTNEKTGGVLSGEGSFKWVEGTTATRFGMPGNAAVRLELGDDPSAGAFVRTYGDADPGAAGIGTPLVRLAAHNAVTPLDALSTVLAPNALAISGPGNTAPAGASSLTVMAAPGFDLARSGYFVDLTPATKPMTITQRGLTAGTSSGNYVYGSPASVATLANIANGDVLQPIATLNGVAGVTMEANGGGFGFTEKTPVGNAIPFALTGVTGAAASNYFIASGSTSGTVTITPRPLNFIGSSGSNTYGTAGTLPSVELFSAGQAGGALLGDDVSAISGLRTAGGQPAAIASRLAAGSYSVVAVGATGTAASNYTIATTGNSPGTYTVNPKMLGVSIADANSTYGTLATLGSVISLSGIEAGDIVTPGAVGLAGGVPLTSRTPAGSYAEVVTSLAGSDAGNYAVGAGSGSLTIARKPITYTGSNIDQQYGQFAIVAPTLTGIVTGDTVAPVASIVASDVRAGSGASGQQPVGDYFVGLTGLTGVDAGNYMLQVGGSVNTRITVTPKPVQFQLSGGTNSSIYGTAATQPAITLSGIVPGDVIDAEVQASRAGVAAPIGERTPAGSYDWGLGRFTGTGAGNYVTAATGNTASTLTVAPRQLNFSVAGASAVYGDAINNPVTLSTILAGDTVTPEFTAFAAGNTATARPVVGTPYTVAVTSLGGAESGNYAIAATGNTTGALTITPRPVNWSVANVGATYGNLATPGAVTLQNVVPGDAVPTTQLVRQNGVDIALQPRTPAGSYQQSVIAVGNANYMLAPTGNTPGVLTIAQRQLTYSTADSTAIYGTAASLPADAVLNGVLAGDDVHAQPTQFARPFLGSSAVDAGTYPNTFITAGLSGGQAGNYTFAATGSSPGALVVTPKPIHYTLDLVSGALALPASVVYGVSSQEFNLSNAARPTLSGVLANDLFDIGLGVNAPNIPLSSSGRYQVGSYTWTGGALTGGRASNYVVAPTGNRDVALQITPRPLPISTSVNGGFLSETYGNADRHTVRADFSPLGADQVQVSSFFITPGGNATQLTARAPVGTYPLGVGPLTGVDAQNYTAQNTQGVPLTIVPREISYQIADTRSTYGQQPTISGVTFSGILAGDDASATTQVNTPGNTLQPNTPAGNYAVTAGTLTGAQAGNYAVRALVGNPDGSVTTSRNGTLTIDRRVLTYTPAAGSLDITYGDIVQLPTLGGTLFNDDVRAAPNVVTAAGVVDLTTSPRLNAGSYLIDRALSGAQSNNYVMEPRTDVVQVARRALTVSDFVDRSTTYGNFIGNAVPTVGNVLPGDTLAIRKLVNTSDGLYSERTDAGNYTEFLDISGVAAANYVAPRYQVALTINPKDLSLQTVAAPRITYGDSTKLATLSGVLFGDDVGVKAQLPGGTQTRLEANAAGDQTLTQRLDVGTYTMPLSLDGGKANNYRIPAAAPVVTINPKDLLYGVANVAGEYGGFAPCSTSNCIGYQPTPFTPGAVTFSGVLNGDAVNGTVKLLDLAGNVVRYDSTLPVGNYFQVVSSLTGRSAGNYKIASSGSLPGIFEVKPTAYYWTTESSIFLPGTGFVGNPGAATVYSGGRDAAGALNGSLLNGDQVTPVVQLRNNLGQPVARTDLKEGQYFWEVVGLTGPAAASYRPLINGAMTTRLDPVNGNTVVTNTLGTLDVYGSSSLGLGFVNPVEAPVVVPPVQLPRVNPLTTPFDAGVEPKAADAGPKLSLLSTSIVSGGVETSARLGDATVSASADGGVTLGLGKGSAAATARAGIETSTQAGDAVMTAQASSFTGTLASYGVTGVSVGANAGAGAGIEFQVGPGFVMFNVQSDVNSRAKLGISGAVLSTSATAGAYTGAGAAGSLGGVGEGAISGTTGAFAYARSDNRYNFEDGRIVMKADEAIGVGASAGGTASISGSAGRVDAGATVYSPGSLGGQLGLTGGYESGVLGIELDLGAQIGIGGLGINVNLQIDFAGTAAAIDKGLVNSYASMAQDPVGRAVVSGVVSMFGMPPVSAPPPPPPSAAALAARQRVTDLENLKNQFQSVVDQQKNTQATFLGLLKTDPKAAIAYSKDGAIRDAQNAQRNLVREASRLGYKLVVADGKIGLAPQ